MASRIVEVVECDRCSKEPAHTWRITGPDGNTREIELCERHATAVANAFALGRPVTPPPVRRRIPKVRRDVPTQRPELEPVWR